MLVAQLKSSGCPINFGDITPRLARNVGRRGSSASASSREAGLGSAGGARPRTASRLTTTLPPALPGGAGSLCALGSQTAAPSSLLALALAEAGQTPTTAPSASSRPEKKKRAASSRPGTTKQSLQDYKVFSNRNSYRGTWLDKRMHGDGLYSWSDGSEYSGEFREGYVWGYGEKRWPNGRRYRGEWVRDMMWGNGEMTWPSGETFTGQFRKGIFHGRGTRTWPAGDWYAGEFKNGEQEGEGTFESAAEGWVYNGHWLHGRMFGEGKVQWPNGIAYSGEWRDGIREGHGRLTWPDGSCYDGQFKSNCIQGHGRKVLPDGSWFEGHFHDSELEGHGLFHWADSTEFEGLWHNSEVVGPGRHTFPDGTTITGVFEDRGASGEGVKRWENGCVYTGRLFQNQIHHYGVLKWPDGRSYVGNFQDETMHGEGMLTWFDKDGMCRYKGCFQRNVFHGEGLLEWSNKARYTGEFFQGLYHGKGTFEWPDRTNVYRGQWVNGEMHGRGVLATNGETGGHRRDGGQFVYVGEFRQGHMQGKGHVTFLPLNVQHLAPTTSTSSYLQTQQAQQATGGAHTTGGTASTASARQDHYKGDFQNSMFHGLGTFSWASGHSLAGLFEENFCNSVGRKVYPDGQVYTGELQMDLEHGKGVLVEAATTGAPGESHRLIGLWREGKCVEELFETFVPAMELDAIEGEEWQKVFGGFREADAPGGGRPGLPKTDQAGEVAEGEAVALFLNGDKYVGHVKHGKKHGLGMYVYADLTGYRGIWAEDVMNGMTHPIPEHERPEQVLKLHRLNEDNQRHVEALKLFAGSGNKPPAREP